ncbi:hypothetical protein SALBM217S_06828 [Streptomyces griseoloalbus]
MTATDWGGRCSAGAGWVCSTTCADSSRIPSTSSASRTRANGNGCRLRSARNAVASASTCTTAVTKVPSPTIPTGCRSRAP